MDCSSSVERVLLIHYEAALDLGSGQVVSSHSIVSSSRTVTLCTQYGGRWMGQRRTTWSTVCSSAPHSQAAEGTIPRLFRKAQKRPTPMWRRLIRAKVGFGKAIPGAWATQTEMKVRSLVVLSNPFAFRRWSAQSAPRMLSSSSDELMSCCAAGTNGCLDLWCHAFPLGGLTSAEWSRWPGSMARRPRHNVALRRSSAGWMPARIGRLSAGVGYRHPVTLGKASLMTGLMRRVWALRNQAGAQYSSVERTRADAAVRSCCPRTQPEPASRLKNATRDINVLQSDSRCIDGVSGEYRFIETKCPFSIKYDHLENAVYLETKTNHNDYFQIQGT